MVIALCRSLYGELQAALRSGRDAHCQDGTHSFARRIPQRHWGACQLTLDHSRLGFHPQNADSQGPNSIPQQRGGRDCLVDIAAWYQPVG